MLLKNFAELPARKRIGIVAIILGIVSIFASNPFSNVNTKVNIKELSLVSADEISEVNVEELSDWLIKGKYDYRLIDLRKDEEYKKYHIPTSENVTVARLLKSDLARNEKIILYSDNDITSAQGWFILKSNNYKGVYVIKGGIESWQKEILFPSCTCDENPTIEQKHKHDKLAEVAKYFGGELRTEGIIAANNKMEMPSIEAPATIELKKPKGKRKREGC
ncbi:MAG: rhodanese-like domain-containing protein [Ignavibacteriales bacterium]|nr:rhodanese-like domain-containing protein [Ignavibacteriota bacterium]MCB9247790.1 rhodanese-like domain-containing protein [Ignavibacteriales bacterium]